VGTRKFNNLIQQMDIKLLSTDQKGTPCSECKAISFVINSKIFEDYFYNKPLICPKCSAKLNLWKLLHRHFEWNFSSYLYSVVGANNTWAEIKMKPNEVFTLDLSKIGINSNSKILTISYTPQESGVMPLEIHNNTPTRHFIPNKIYLFGRPFGEAKDETRVLITIDWVENYTENSFWQNLIEAVEAFSLNQLPSAIIPANVAVESRLTPIISEYLEDIISKKRVEDFLSQAATYSHQLNILLPLLAKIHDFPQLPDFIRGNLNALRGLRNEIAHVGKLKNADKATVATMLCSATFGLAYLNLLEQKLRS
jgi:hypothetical protein